MRCLLFLALLLLASAAVQASTLAPDLKAYDFCRAYSIENGGVILAPYPYGFYTTDGTKVPHGIQFMPGDRFMQFDASRMVVDQYRLVRLGAQGTRAFFHQVTCRYKVVKYNGKFRDIIGQQVDSEDFYITKWRSAGWYDSVFPLIRLNPGAQAWRTRPQY